MLVAAIAPLTIYRFTVSSPRAVLNEFPEKRLSHAILGVENETFFTRLATWLEARIDAATLAGAAVLVCVVTGIPLAILFCAMVIDRIVQGAFRDDGGR